MKILLFRNLIYGHFRPFSPLFCFNCNKVAKSLIEKSKEYNKIYIINEPPIWSKEVDKLRIRDIERQLQCSNIELKTNSEKSELVKIMKNKVDIGGFLIKNWYPTLISNNIVWDLVGDFTKEHLENTKKELSIENDSVYEG